MDFSWRSIQWWCSLGIFHPDFPRFHPALKASQRKPEEVVQFIGVPGQVWSHGFWGGTFFPEAKRKLAWVSYHSICSGKLTFLHLVRGSDKFLYLKIVILLSFVWNQSQAMKMCALNVTTRRQWVCISRNQSCWRIAMWRMRRLRLVSIFSSHLFRIGKIKTWEDDQSCTDQCMLYIHRQSQSCQRYIKSIRHLKLMSTRVYHSGIQGANADLPNRFFQGGSNVGPVRCFLLYCEVGWVKIKNLNKPWRLLFKRWKTDVML
jgi:hypothetical protein